LWKVGDVAGKVDAAWAAEPRTAKRKGTGVRIQKIETFVVNVPFTTNFASSFDARSGTTRTIIRVEADSGHEGWGETLRGEPTRNLIERHKSLLIGEDPFELERILEKFRMTPFFYGYTGYAAIAAIEMACWDLMGKFLHVPLAKLIGGMYREKVPVTGILSRGMLEPGTAAQDVPRGIADLSIEFAEKWGVDTIKVKGSYDAEADVAMMIALREAQPTAKLRVDPNAVWSVQQSYWAGLRLEPLDLEYLEDPCAGIEGMAQVRRHIRIPLCTNMCVVEFHDFPPAIRLGAVDIVHGDVHKWGGVLATKRLGALCQTFGLGMNMHSGGELGISTACHVHVVASMPEIRYAIDSLYYLLADDIVTEMIPFSDGHLSVPTGPGLGVEVDREKLDHYDRTHREEGDLTL
jgi:glucarate dehydratase